MMLKVLCAAVAASAFGVVFNLGVRDLCFAALNAAIGYFIYLQAMGLGLPSFVAIFIASIIMSVYAEIIARMLKRPASLFLITALIPFVPGGRLFQLVLSLINMDTSSAWSFGMLTILESGAIAFGIIIVSSLIKLFPQKR